MDTVLIGDIDMASHIEMISFEEGPPLYLQQYKPSFSLIDKRLTLESLHNLYDMFDSNSSGGELLDSQTFITLILLNLQNGLFPKQWRSVSFEKFIALIQNYCAMPKSDSDKDQQLLFRRNSMKNLDERTFVNWKVLFTAFTLIANVYPKTKDL